MEELETVGLTRAQPTEQSLTEDMAESRGGAEDSWANVGTAKRTIWNKLHGRSSKRN